MFRIVALYEFLSIVKRRSFILITLGAPIVVGLYFGLIFVVLAATQAVMIDKESKPIGIIDRAQITTGPGGPLEKIPFGGYFEYRLTDSKRIKNKISGEVNIEKHPANRTLLRLRDLESAQKALDEEEIKSAIVIPEDYLSSGVLHKYVKESSILSAVLAPRILRIILSESIMHNGGLPRELQQRILEKPLVVEYEIGPEGTFVEFDFLATAFPLCFAFAVSMLMVTVLIVNANLMVTSVLEEKQNKVVEVILSSISPDHLLFGKIIGLTAVGLVQLVIWLAMVSIAPSSFAAFLEAPLSFDLGLGRLAIATVFTVLGLVFYGSLLVGLGSLASNEKDSRSLTSMVTLCAWVPIVAVVPILIEPDGFIPRFLSLIPLFSAPAMTLRLSATDPSILDIGLSLLLLIASIWLAVRCASRLFRVGTLLQGKRPSVGEIWTMLRSSSL